MVQGFKNIVKKGNTVSMEYAIVINEDWNDYVILNDGTKVDLTVETSSDDLFEKYKDNPKEGMKVAIDIMLNVNEENEKELFELYDINLEKYLNAYKLKNNRSVKRRTN